MKKTILVLGVVLAMVTGYAVRASHTFPVLAHLSESAIFNWVAKEFDFGKIKLNNPVTHEFKFRNSGSVPLVISSVQASCGCTVADYTKDPIPAGEEGFVKATYNAARAGMFTKTVTVNANTADGVVVLTIKGEVIE